MDKLKMHSPNKVDENIEKIGKLFPNCLTERLDEDGKPEVCIDFDMLKQELSSVVVDGNEERYQFTWPDKKKSILLANAPINKTLRPCREESVDFDNTENLYIEGDNLEVLKLLQETYLGKIKMIYIDPPYNTGSDAFIYDDDSAIGTGEFSERSGQRDDNGNLLFDMRSNNESNGRFHTDWLNMMYTRLKLARDLLTDDGSIFVSIDFNEVDNLKKIMDEIFGAENFQREIIWRIGWLSGYKTMAPNFIRNHDTILFYSKDHTKLFFNKKYIENKDFKPLIKRDTKLSQKLSQLGLSDAQQKDLVEFINHGNRPERYPIEDTWNSNEYDDLNSIAIVSFSGEKISKILEVDQDFKGQKSIKMLMRIIEATTKDNDIILDFFAGTSSTAHAVLQQNLTDDYRRRFIMVQLPELTEESSAASKAGYKNICEIGKERIRRAGAKINSELRIHNSQLNEESSTSESDEMQLSMEGLEDKDNTNHNSELPTMNYELDTGFRVLKLDSSNMKDVYYNPAEYVPSMFESLADNIKEDRTPEDLLFQVMLDLGILLSGKIEETEIAGKKVFNVADGFLIACFDADVTDEVITEIAKKKPYYFVTRDHSMASDSVATNFDQIFATYSPDTVRKVL